MLALAFAIDPSFVGIFYESESVAPDKAFAALRVNGDHLIES